VSKQHRPAASPFAFSMREIARRPGEQSQSSKVVPAPAVLGTDLIGVPKGNDVELTVSFESLSEGIWVHGTVAADAVGECSRCLDEVRLKVSAPVQGLFVYDEIKVEDGEEESEDTYEFDGDVIDLEELTWDAVITGLPFIPLCRPDCPGLCDQCGARLADDPDHAHDVIDPRWSALQGLTETKES
jgi:uncharacterized protein